MSCKKCGNYMPYDEKLDPSFRDVCPSCRIKEFGIPKLNRFMFTELEQQKGGAE
jgi:hypothetical protein